MKVTVGAQSFTAELYDNPTAYDLADQLPLTLTVKDLNGLEKTGPLPRALTTDGVPRESDPEPNEIGYYSPGHDLVLYYGDVGYYTGIIRIGRFDTAIDRIADEPHGIAVTVERHVSSLRCGPRRRTVLLRVSRLWLVRRGGVRLRTERPASGTYPPPP